MGTPEARVERAARSTPTFLEVHMATGETGFDDVNFDLVSVQYHALKAGHDYGQYVRDAENAGLDEVADFFRQVMSQDSDRAHQCHRFLAQLTSKSSR